MNARELLFIIKARNAARGVINQFRTNLKGIGTAAKVAQGAFNKMGTSIRGVSTAAKQATANLKNIGKTQGIKNATASFQRMRKGIANTLKEALTLKGVLAGFGAAFVLRGAFTTLVSFSDEMAKVRAISGATADQFENMKSKAAELGTTTRFTATQAAEGMTFLSRAGFSAEQSIDAIASTLDLAQAGALDLGRAADIVSNIMSAFGIDTSRTSDAVDILAIVANNSNTSIEQLGDAMKFAAPLSASLGLSLQETAAAIGALGQAGIQGGAAGAGLQIFLSKLVNLKESSRDAFEAAGVNLQKISPLTNSLEEILDALADSSFGAAEAVEAFGARGLRTVLSLLKQRETFDKLTEAEKTAAGAAKEFARIMDDQLGGAVKAIISAFQGLVIALGETGVINVLEGLIRGVATAVRGMAFFLTAIGDVVKSVPGLTGVLKGLGIAIGVLVAAGGIPLLISGFAAFVGGAGVATTAIGGFIRALTIGPIVLFGTAVKAGAVNLIRWSGAAKIGALANIIFSRSTLALLNPIKLVSKAFVVARTAMLGFAAASGGTAVGGLSVIIGGLLTALKTAALFILGPLVTAFVALGAIGLTVAAAIAAVVAALGFLAIRGADTAQGTVTLGNLLQATWEKVSKSIIDTTISIAKGINDLLPEFLQIEDAAQAVKDAWASVGEFFSNLGNTIAGGLGSVVDALFPEDVIKRARELTDLDEATVGLEEFADAAKTAARTTSAEMERLGKGMTDAEKAAAALGIEFTNNKDRLEAFIAKGNPLVSVLRDNEHAMRAVGNITKFTDKQLKALGVTRDQLPGIIARSTQAMEDELRPLRRLNQDRAFEISLIGKSKLAIDQERLARENALAVKRGEQLVDAEGLRLAREQLRVQAQRQVNFANLERLEALDEELELIKFTGVAREEAAARQKILNQAIDAGTSLIVAQAAADVEAFAIRRNAQAQFLRDFDETNREHAIEAALISRDREEVERLEVAMDAMKAAKEAGFSTKEIKELGDEAVRSFDRIKAAQDAFQENGLNGFRRAMDDYIDESKRFADAFEDVTLSALRKTENALGDLVTGGKVDFKSLVQSIGDDFARLGAKRITGFLAEAAFGGRGEPSSANIAGQAAGLLGPDAIHQPVVIAAQAAAVSITEGGQQVSTSLNTGAEATRVAFEQVKTLTTNSGTTASEAIRIAGSELANCIRAVCESIEACACGGGAVGAAGGGGARGITLPGATDFITSGGDRDMVQVGGRAPAGALQAFQQQSAQSAKNLGVFLEKGNQDYAQVFKTATESAAEVGSVFTSDLGSSFTNILGGLGGIFSSLFGGGGGFAGGGGASVFSSLLSIGSSFFSFAKGGVASAQGAMNVSRFAKGGITNSPTVAMFGEGGTPEAFVPLPDGRRIPVDMRGGEPQRPINVNVIQNIQTPDAASFGRNQEQLARKGALAFQRSMTRDN